MALLQASCALVGYDAQHAPLEAGTDGPELPEAALPSEDASFRQTHEVDAAVARDGGALGPIDAAVPADAEVLLDAAWTVAPSTPFEEQDAGVVVVLRDAGALDASVDSVDAGACAGARVLGVCWYLASAGQNCNATCAAHGGVDGRAASLVGTTSQGGSLGSCAQILPALGATVVPLRAFRSDPYGLGCHTWSTGVAYWLDDPSPLYSTSSLIPLAARVSCGCAR